MSQKFISLADAAEQLGISKDRLNELRESGDLRAYRDGASWKFRTEEIDKLAESGELTDGAGGDADEDDDDDLVLGVEPLEDGDDAESILLTDDEVGLPRPQSTIIGKSELSLEDDLALGGESDASASDVSQSGSFANLEELELDLEAESSRILDPSSAAAAKQAAESAGDSPSDDLALGDDDEYELELAATSDAPSGPDVTDGGDLAGGSEGSGAPGSIAGLSGLEDIQLGEDDQDDLVLGGGDSDSGLASSDSGINLAPSDSGIALDDVSLDLGGSAIGSALDLAALSAASADQSKAGGDDAGLASAEDFELTPASAAEDEEEEDSSQIVALDDFEEVGEEEEATFEEVEEMEGGFGSALGSSLGGAAAMPSAAGAALAAPGPAVAGAATVEQVAFPGWIIILLALSFMLMVMCGIMAFDLLQSMWAWDEPFSINSALMDVFAG